MFFVSQGIEGKLLRRHLKTDRYTLAENARKSLPAPVVQISLRLAELGWLYCKVSSFCEKMEVQKEVGLIGKSFVTALKNELAEYYRLVHPVTESVRAHST